MLVAVPAAWAPNDGGGGSGCHDFCYYVGWLSSTGPIDQCLSVFPSGSQRIACSGWNNWDRSRVYKAGGGWIRVGFWNPDRTMHYLSFTGTRVDPNPIVVLRTDPGLVGGPANSYNAVTCAYDVTNGGDASSVECDALIF